MTFVLRDTPFALHTSSRILLETYAGSPGEQGAPLWMGLEHNLLEFIQTQADLSKFLEEFGRTEKSQVGRRSVQSLFEILSVFFHSVRRRVCCGKPTPALCRYHSLLNLVIWY